MTKDPRVYLARPLGCAEKIERVTAEGKERFFRDKMMQDAVLRNLEVIDETAKRLDDAYPSADPEIPWRVLGGLRDVLIDQYEGVDLKKVGGHRQKRPPRPERTVAELPAAMNQFQRELPGKEEPRKAHDHGWNGYVWEAKP